MAEFSTELNPGTIETLIVRGTGFANSTSYYRTYPGCKRCDYVADFKNDRVGFRTTLFLK